MLGKIPQWFDKASCQSFTTGLTVLLDLLIAFTSQVCGTKKKNCKIYTFVCSCGWGYKRID